MGFNHSPLYLKVIDLIKKQFPFLPLPADKLGGKGFFRCHKSYLINLKYVDGYNRQEAVLENGEKIVIAKRRYDRFVQEMLAVMRKNGGII